MKASLLLFWFALFQALTASAQTPSQPKLASVIDSLYAADQGTMALKPATSAAAAFQRVIRTNFPLVKSILDTYGYPGYALVGKESSEHYFTLVQHSDFDSTFQRRVLHIMRREVLTKNASGRQLAFLTDRIAVTQGKPQVYGTQVLMSGNTTVKPCLAPDKLNERRKTLGLEPIEEYLAKCNAFFYEVNPGQRPKPTTN